MAKKQTKEGTWIEAMDLAAAGRALSAIDSAEGALEATSESGLPAIEGYVIDRRLGGGGGGEVYRAVRTGSDQPVAIKLLNKRLGETPEAKRAWRELDVLEQLRHPSIPRLLDQGVHDGRMYFATEYVDGHPLLEHCDVNQLDRAARVELLASIADAVQALHEFGVIHRDLKPSNILIDRHGRPMLVDLGIATLLSGDVMETLTVAGAPIGSPAFMAPEQARGEKSAVSTRSDVYGLGATAYVLLTGDTPHDMDATLHEAIRRVAQDPPRDPRELEPRLPKPLAAVLAKAVVQEPENRYASAAELAADLRRWHRGEPVEAGGLSIAQRVGRHIGHHPVAATAALLSAD
ncbi:MAG: serine/threonine protein kinase [Planctomycetes bacterium]|nr:serine/threonine protein kinase [Planctomycetota bacterium]